MKYSIVIPTYNHCDDLLKPCIESVIQYTDMSNVELIVSANGCTDNTGTYLDNLQIQFNELGLYNNLKVVWNNAALGFAKATNEGIKVATTDKIVLLNNDTVLLGQVKNTWLNLLEAPFLSNAKCGVSTVIEGFSPSAGGTYPIFFCVMIDRTVFDTIGLLNEAYGVGGGEDTEFSIEAKAAGFDISLALDMQYSHDIGTNVGQFPIYHIGEGTMHDASLVPDHNNVIRENSIRLAKKYNPKWLLENAPEHANKIKYSIVIPTYNHCDDLLKPCIDSIIAYTDLSQTEIIVVANGCTDNTRIHLDNLQAQFSELGLHNNLKVVWVADAIGYTRATNIGINHAVSEYVILLSNDVDILPSAKNQWLDMLEAPFLSNQKMAVTGPEMRYHLTLDALGLVFFCVMIKRSVFDTIGILDEMYSPGGNEDHDFCLRATLAGYDLSDTGPNFPCVHKGNQTLKEFVNHKYSYNNRPFIEKFKKLRPIKYSIVIPTYNHCADLLKPCIDSIIAYTDLSQIEVIIVANGCTDDTGAYVNWLNQNYVVEYHRRPFKLVWADEALGYTRAANLGIDNALGEYIILLNNDTEITPSDKNTWINILEAPFADKQTAIAGPLQLYDHDVQSHFIVFFCAMIPRSIFDSIGKLDEIFNPGYGEDIDFAMRAKLAGYTIAVVGQWPGNTDIHISAMPIWHKNNQTFGAIPDYGSIIVPRNQKILKERYTTPSTITESIRIDRTELQNQHPDTYNQIFENNEYGIEELDIRGKVVIDIGANLGMFTLRCVELGAAHVYAVEAQPTVYQTKLVKNVSRYSTVTPMNYAAFSQDGLIVNIPNEHVMSKLGDIGEPVNTITLKKLLTDYQVAGNNLVLKLDCEGSEFDILMTAEQELIRRFEIIYMELHGNTNSKPEYHDVGIIRNQLTLAGFTIVKSGQYFGGPAWTPLDVFVEKWVRI